MVWGTQEELLLACAVDRHGTRRWDSVATELQSRSSVFPSVSPLACQKKFNDLRRRFFKSRQPDESASLVDKLRKIRVEELRREVQRRDESILSLELKVKRLEEEKERSVIGEEAVDLKDRQANDAGESVAGGESDFCENGSFKESNSSSQRGGERKIAKREPYEPVHGGGTGNEPDRDGSINVNSDGVDDKDDNINKIKTMETAIQPNGVGESNEEVLLEMESMGESKREKDSKEGAAASKQSSDVQSSASLSKKTKKKRRRKGGGAVVRESSSSEEEEDADEVSPATFRTTMTKRALAVKCEPMVRLLETIRSHRLGSVFERRLRSQEWARYKNLIRQHMDLQTVQSRIDKGMYSDCTNRFFRDLLLLFNNAVVFFSRNSPEHAAALELRAIVCKGMTVDYKLTTPKLEPQVDSVSKPKEASAMVVCGRRSSAKAISENRKGVKKEAKVEENHKPPPYDHKTTRVIARKVNDSFASTEENGHFWKKSSGTNKDTSNVLGRRSAKTSKGGEEHEYGGNELSSHDALEAIKTIDKMRETSSTAKKKQGAARFLRRMKQNSPSSSEGEEEEDDGNEEEDVLSSEDTDSKSSSKRRGNRDEEKKKKRRGRKEVARRERVTRSSGGRGVREESGKVKRGVGRPPKRSGTGKKRKDNEEDSEGVVVAGRPRKRSRR